MDTITLHAKSNDGVTLVSNVFIDHYMPAANGSYVKVYLYLLRCLSSHSSELSISFLADCLDDTEKDIIRALNYWEKVNLISTKRSTDGTITDITLCESLCNDQNLAATSDTSHLLTSTKETTAHLTPPPNADETSDAYQPQKTETSKALAKFERPAYSAAQVTELTNNDEIKWLLNIIEVYMERPLKSCDIQLILFLYETVHFSAELIMYLYEYCVSKGKKHIAYIEAVALSWAENQVDTVEKAELSSARYNQNYSAVMKAFGLNRDPAEIEKNFIKKWVEVFGFDTSIIVEACNRAVLHTQKPDFNYTDNILKKWHKDSVKQLSDIHILDANHKKTATLKQNSVQPNKPSQANNNKFNAFPQRNYTKDDYSSMEKKLLQKSLNK